MMTIKVELKLFKYEELNETARETAFNDHKEFIRNFPSESENDKGEIIPDNMDNWSLEEIKVYVEESIKINDYFFFENGGLAECTTYAGKQEKAGITELTFNGVVYVLPKGEENEI